MKNLFFVSLTLMCSFGAKAQTKNIESKSNVIAADLAYGSNSLHYAIAPVQQLGIVSFLIITQKEDMLQWKITDAAGKVINTAPLQNTGKLVFEDIPAGSFSEEKAYRWQVSNASGSTIATIDFTGKNCIPDTNTNHDN